ncbi:MAG: DUF1080 domain-containing protein [Bryobacteraceae bacterium]
MRLLYGYALLILLPAFALGQQPNQPLNKLTKKDVAQGWHLLFDGKTMAGWEDPSKKDPPGDGWTIEDGCLKVVAKPRITEDLVSAETFDDFELAFEWRVAAAGNSGVKYRIQDRIFVDHSKIKPDMKRWEDVLNFEILNRVSARRTLAPGVRGEDYTVAFEYQLTDDAQNPDAKRSPMRSTGALYNMVAPSGVVLKPLGEFNQSRIVVRGNHVEHWLNGVKVVDTSLDSPEVVKSITARWGADSAIYKLLAHPRTKGCPISLQNHNDDAWFRSVKIRRLGRQ